MANRLSDKGQAALEYVRQGLYVTPLCWPIDGKCGCPKHHTNESEVGKAPLLGNGYQNILSTVENVQEWWGEWPDANVGILLEPSGLVDVEADSADALEEIQSYGVNGTNAYRSGRGVHNLYKALEGMSGRRIKKGVSKAIDVLASGYVVAPPSVHRCGKGYEWVDGEGGVEGFEPPPFWVVRMFLQDEAVLVEDNVVEVELNEVVEFYDVRDVRVPNNVKQLIVSGYDEKYPSRSEAIFAVIRYMLLAGHSYDNIASVLLHYPVGEKIQQHKNPLAKVAQEIVRAVRKTTKESKADADGEAEGLTVRSVGLLEPYKVVLASEWEPDGPLWIIDGFLEAGYSVLSGATSSGKSSLVRQLCVALSKGDEFLGFGTNKCNVLYVSHPLEGGAVGLNRAFKSLEPPSEGLYITRDDEERGAEVFIDRLGETVSKYDIKFVVIDTIKRYLRTQSGDRRAEYDSVVELTSLMSKITESGVSILGLTHTSKSGGVNPTSQEFYTSPSEAPIGSVAWGASANSRLLLRNYSGKYKTDEMYCALILEHKNAQANREGLKLVSEQHGDTFRFRLMSALEWAELISTGSSKAVTLQSEIDSVLEYLSMDNWISKNELLEYTGIPRRSMERITDALKLQGVIESGRRGYKLLSDVGA